ncbi:MAG TPA: cation:proton antiporter [Pyrinomonadaceae bacterium]|nr:cation:proton antiporter [Pyrinomonadaceae bacterium]
MPQIPLLQDLLVLLAAAVPIAFVFNRLRLPVLAGFMATGVLIGPYGLALIHDSHAIEALAEVGVVLLLFTIGLEFSMRRLMGMKRLVFAGGGLQVMLTTAVVAGIALLALGRQPSQSLFFGFLFALSSTAIVLKSYVDRAEVDAPHGRAGVGVLLFQDLSIVPMMLLVPVLGGDDTPASRVVLTLGAAALAVGAIVVTARVLVPRLLHLVVSLRSQEVFILTVVLLVLGTSWLTATAGLSLALGAFIAGMVLSESEYSHQIVADILPFRDVFNSVFFISIGMLLSLGALWSDLWVVLGLVGALVAGKSLLTLLVLRVLGTPLRVAATAGIGLAQVGEFSFILARVGVSDGLLGQADYQRFLAASIISMVATPFLIKLAPSAGYWLHSRLSPATLPDPSVVGFSIEEPDLRGHVIIVGYGLNGRNLSRVLRRTGVKYLVLELNAGAVREAAAWGERIIYGDATRREVLRHARVEQARVVVLAISDPSATRRTLWLVRRMNPDAHIIARTRYMSEVEELRRLGADDVIPEEFETSVEIFARVLREYGVSREDIRSEVEEIRSEGYGMLRETDLTTAPSRVVAAALAGGSTETLGVRPEAAAVGRTIGQLRLRTLTGVTVLAVTRDGRAELNPDADFRVEGGDNLVLFGSPEQIDRAIEVINGENPARPDG